LTREQQTADKRLEQAQSDWLAAYGWSLVDGRWKHPNMPTANPRGYATGDAMAFTRAEKLRYGGPR
jgi:hypothetical protein